MPTGRNGISNGKADYSINGIYSADIGSYHTDINLVATRVGAPDSGANRNQALWAASLSTALNERWGVVGEFSGTEQRGAESTGRWLFAASYNLSKSIALDAGLSRSLRSGNADRSIFAGMTVLLGRLF